MVNLPMAHAVVLQWTLSTQNSVVNLVLLRKGIYVHRRIDCPDKGGPLQLVTTYMNSVM